MAFKAESVRFSSKSRFLEYGLSFAADENLKFLKDNGENATASIDFAVSHMAKLSARRHKDNVREMKKASDEAKERASADNNKIVSSNNSGSYEKENYSDGDKRFDSSKKGEKSNERTSSKESISKEKKKAAQKTAIEKVLKAKGLIGGDSTNDKSTGDALRDGNSGLVKMLTDLINPATYLKQLFIKMVAAVAPHFIVVLMFLFTAMILIAIVVGMFSSINTVSTTVTGYVSRFAGRGSIITENALTEEEINEIVAGSGASGRQTDVVRFALSRVGYPYSQALRTSGTYYDCSSLAYYCWQAAGVDISYGGNYPPTAALEASKLYTNGTVVNSTKLDIKDMEPGDLIFYGGHDNGRFLGIYHVAVYVGNGECVEALNEDHGIVYQTLRTKDIILVLRP